MDIFINFEIKIERDKGNVCVCVLVWIYVLKIELPADLRRERHFDFYEFWMRGDVGGAYFSW